MSKNEKDESNINKMNNELNDFEEFDWERASRCAKEIDAVLLKNNCVLDVSMNISIRGIIPKLTVIPLKEKDEVPNDPTRFN